MRRVTRAYLTLIGVIGLATGGVLLAASDSTADYFAWPIGPPLTAVFMGAGYLGTGVTLLLGAGLARTWAEARLIVPPIAVFALTMITATLLHADRFRWDRPVTWLWIGLYLVIIAGGAGVASLEGRRQDTASIRLARPERAALILAGLLTMGWAAPLFVEPTAFSGFWPWPLTPLTGRVVAGWTAVAATLAVACAVANDARGLRLPLLGWIVTVVLFLGTSAANTSGMRGELQTAIYFGALGASVGGAAWLLWRTRR